MESPTVELNDSSSMVTPDGSGPDLINETTKEPHPHDVLCGRGGSINSHPGNERFRTLVEKRKRVYLTARFKREKRLIASSIVSEIRNLQPSGRFLQLDKKSGLWKDIGDEKARDKTSQALRENAPTIRSEIEAEINEHRAEIQKEEEEAKAKAAAHMPPEGPPSYYQGGWGPYQSYYGYSHHAPPPPPHHAHAAAHPGYYPPPPEGQWGYYPPPPPGHHPLQPPPHPHQQAPSSDKSAFEQTAEYIASSADSLRRYAEDTLSFGGSVSAGMGDMSLGGDHSRGSRDSHDHDGSVGSARSQPLSYVHQEDSKKRRMVKFKANTKRHTKRRPGTAGRYPPSSSSTVNSSNSLLDGGARVQDMEPQALDAEQNANLMNQVSNQILTSLGSWDAGSVFCGNDTVEKTDAPFNAQPAPVPSSHQEPVHEQEDEMAVEWEGQEVQLLDNSVGEYEGSVASEDRMPPPSRAFVPDHQSSVAYSSLGSCHSWLPVSEQFSTAASYFSGRGTSEGHLDIDAAAALAADQSAGGSARMMAMDGSLQSIGGGSLTRVFEDEVMPDTQQSIGSANMGQRVLATMPSWERNLRSRSPLSIESDDEDVSLISKSSSKHSAENHIPAMNPAHGMSWEQKE
eukprot:CAMPEP_0172457276 /NCGR_PEP_ID=MMETSP1065-20121228/21188_1 /TAXON_ID=265537 /ORGANISM="Amphiprora paludosa, Strain CCMP125" /LENGTH=625 /DNA_ID=CAMNT_0013210903 /DNA_START=201 /DNA_END=2078 /DNA_ORIENTATION=+